MTAERLGDPYLLDRHGITGYCYELFGESGFERTTTLHAANRPRHSLTRLAVTLL